MLPTSGYGFVGFVGLASVVLVVEPVSPLLGFRERVLPFPLATTTRAAGGDPMTPPGPSASTPTTAPRTARFDRVTIASSVPGLRITDGLPVLLVATQAAWEGSLGLGPRPALALSVLAIENGHLILGTWQRLVVVDPNRENNRRTVQLRLLQG